MDLRELKKLKQLRDSGKITEEEFQEEKMKLKNDKGEKRMGILTLLGYIIGVLLILLGSIGFAHVWGAIGGMFLLLAGFIVIPCFNELLEERLNFKLSRAIRIVLFCIFLMLFVICSRPICEIPSIYNIFSNSNLENDEIEVREPFVLNHGKYVVGKDIQEGKYDLEVVSGTGKLKGSVESLGLLGINELMAEKDSPYVGDTHYRYNNLILKDGDNLELSGDVEIKFINKK